MIYVFVPLVAVRNYRWAPVRSVVIAVWLVDVEMSVMATAQIEDALGRSYLLLDFQDLVYVALPSYYGSFFLYFLYGI